MTYVGDAAGAPPITIDAGPARAGHRHGRSPRRRRSRNLRAVGCDVDGDGGSSLTVTPPPWRGDITDPFDLVEEVARIVGYANVPSVLPPAPAGRGLTRSQQLRRRVGRTLAGRGLRRGGELPVRRRRATSTRSALPADDPRRRRAAAGQPAVVRRARDDHHAAARPARRRSPATPAAAAPTWPCSRRPRSPCRGPRVRRRSSASTSGRPTGQLDELDKALPGPAAAPRRWSSRGDRERAGWWGEGRPATWADAVDGVRARRPRRSASRSTSVPAARAPWHPGRCAEMLVGDARPRVTPASCTRGCARRTASRPAPPPPRST